MGQEITGYGSRFWYFAHNRPLEVPWDTEAVVLSIKIKKKEPINTRRDLLSIMSSVYDPLGLISPIVLQAKIIMQDECRLGKGRDEPMDESNVVKWHKWLKELPMLEGYHVNRCFVPDFGEIKTSELHHFADASQEGSGCVSYIRLVNHIGQVHCAFVTGEAIVAPIKTMTIPRLELQAAVLAVKINKAIARELTLKVDDTGLTLGWPCATSETKQEDSGSLLLTGLARYMNV